MLALDPPFLEAAADIAAIGFLGFVGAVFGGALWLSVGDRAADPLKWGA